MNSDYSFENEPKYSTRTQLLIFNSTGLFYGGEVTLLKLKRQEKLLTTNHFGKINPKFKFQAVIPIYRAGKSDKMSDFMKKISKKLDVESR